MNVQIPRRFSRRIILLIGKLTASLLFQYQGDPRAIRCFPGPCSHWLSYFWNFSEISFIPFISLSLFAAMIPGTEQ